MLERTHRSFQSDWGLHIPNTWRTGKLKYLADVRLSSVDKKREEGEQEVRLCNYTDVYNNATIGNSIDFMVATASKEEIRRFALRKGDVIVTKDSEAWDDIAVPAYVAEDLDSVLCGYHLALVRPDPSQMDGQFLRYAFAARGIAERFHIEALGVTRFALGNDALASVTFPAPTLPVQRTIAAFLDSETTRIDALIAKKERLLELLEEKRTALITRAVTKGLDQSVTMKESGVKWLAEVPAHWSVAPLYSRYVVALGKMLDQKRVSGDFLAPYIRNVNVQWDRVTIDDLPTMDFEPHERARYRLQPGDLLVCEGGEVGRTAMWRGEVEECYYQKAIHRLRPKNANEHARFFYYVMHATAKLGVFVAAGNPNTINHLTADQLSHHRFAFPPAPEQVTIATVLDEETRALDMLVSKVHDAIALLREYRIALISAAVTGQIDVREHELRAK